MVGTAEPREQPKLLVSFCSMENGFVVIIESLMAFIARCVCLYTFVCLFIYDSVLVCATQMTFRLECTMPVEVSFPLVGIEL